MITDEAKRFKAFRKRIKMSQIELTEFLVGKGLLKITQSVISKYELGKYPVPIEVVKVLHIYFRLNYKWFYHGILPMIETESIKKTIPMDLKEIMLTIDVIREKLENQDRVIKKLVRDVYAAKE